VIFDRIRENLRLRKGDSFAETANISLLETMARSVNTSVTVLFVLVAVYMLGGVSLRTFTFAFMIGTIAGSYSSIFNAAQLLVVLKNWEERAIARRRAAAGRAAPGRAASGRPSRAAARPGGAARVSQGVRARPVREPVEKPKEAAPEQAAAEGAAVGDEAAGADAAGRRKSRAARRKLKTGRKRRKRF